MKRGKSVKELEAALRRADEANCLLERALHDQLASPAIRRKLAFEFGRPVRCSIPAAEVEGLMESKTPHPGLIGEVHRSESPSGGYVILIEWWSNEVFGMTVNVWGWEDWQQAAERWPVAYRILRDRLRVEVGRERRYREAEDRMREEGR